MGPGNATNIEDVTTYGTGTAPLAVAHRGGSGLALENTMNALRRSAALGLRYLEFDIRLTADRVPVLFHDATLDRVAGRPGRLAQLTLAQLSEVELPGGTWIPTLADVLHAFPEACFMVDLKDPAALLPVLEQLERHGACGRACLTGSFDRRITAEHGRVPASLSPKRMTALVASGRRAPIPWSRMAVRGATFVHVPFRLDRLSTYRPLLLERARALGLRTMVWGVERPEDMHRLLDDGADGIITDHPDRIRDVLIARGQWVPWTRPLPRLDRPTRSSAAG